MLFRETIAAGGADGGALAIPGGAPAFGAHARSKMGKLESAGLRGIGSVETGERQGDARRVMVNRCCEARNGTMDFFFDYSCPYAYVAFTQLARLEAASRLRGACVRIVLRPMLLGGVFAARGTAQNLMNVLGEAKARHNFDDMARWAALFGVPLRIPSEHPRRTVEALRATIATGVDPAVVAGFYRAYWVEGRAPSDPATITDVVTAAGHDASEVLRRTAEGDVKQALRAATDEAIAKNVFGAPSFVREDGELFWGQDRMHFAFDLPYDQILHQVLPEVMPSSTVEAPTMHTLELYWDFSSPYAYLASTQAEALAKRTGSKLVWRPMLLGAVFKQVGQVDVPILSFSDAKRDYLSKDMFRWAEHWAVPFRFPSRFPVNTVKALRVYLALPEERRDAFRAATFRAYWAEDRDIADDAVLRELVGDPAAAEAALARTQDPAVKQALFEATDRAVKAGVFGAPSWIIDEKELFWGQDRIPLVEHALSRN